IAPDDLLDTPERARLSTEDFILLVDSGALDSFAKSELIDGDVYVMNAQWTRHAGAKSMLALELGLWLRETGSAYRALVEVAIHAAPDSMPEPDIVVTRWRGGGAVPSDTIALVVEVSETTRRIDLGRKAAIYAAAGIPEYWVVDLKVDRFRVHRDPGPSGYAAVTDVPFGATVTASTIEGLRVDTAFLAD
ncbi:MAG: Uma2 family endonuclease, partial [Sphingomonadaceae bacterium]|nr:Uma2 family endonuclease [Sphingomonadaceae bacterium]